MHPLLQHVLDDDCTDPDCEIHQIEVGLSEEVVSETDLAFFLAGAMRAYNLIREDVGGNYPFNWHCVTSLPEKDDF